MKINRIVNGIEMEFELTQQELWEAYEEKQHKFDIADIESAFEDLTDDELVECYGKTLAELNELKEAMACRYRKYRDNYDESWINDRDEAIRWVLLENEKYV